MAGNPEQWLILTTGEGNEVENPTHEDLRRAVTELGNHKPEGKADDFESSTVDLRYGLGGSTYMLSVDRDGTASFSVVNEGADDPVVELSKKLAMDKSLELLFLLADGSPDKVEAELSKDVSRNTGV